MPAFLAPPPLPARRPRRRCEDRAPRCSAAPPRAAEVVVVGGGAAGYYLAIACASAAGAAARVRVLEAGPRVLQKVRISGGGRCNVTSGLHHGDARAFAANYPRGARALVSVLARYGAPDVVAFFERHRVPLKTEPSGKIFPVSDSSESVIAALRAAAARARVSVRTRARVRSLAVADDAGFSMQAAGGEVRADFVAVATGSAPEPLKWAQALGHTLVPQVPSLFSFRVQTPLLSGLAGVAVADAVVRLQQGSAKGARGARGAREGFVQRGAVLVTHWGVSGPAVLTLSAFAARVMHAAKYEIDCMVDWIPALPLEEKVAIMKQARRTLAQRNIVSSNPFRGQVALPKRLWRAIVEQSVDAEDVSELKWSSVTNALLNRLAEMLHRTVLPVSGKGEFKDEFVTAGGVPLKEVDMKTFESKKVKGLYFAGEVLDVDGKTGGFNLEFAWSSGYLAGTAIAEKVLASHIATAAK